eukprot:scaffold5016_cov118-Isochrysis_galbana.AAC.7
MESAEGGGASVAALALACLAGALSALSAGSTASRTTDQIPMRGPDTRKAVRHPPLASAVAATLLAKTPPRFSHELQIPMAVPRTCASREGHRAGGRAEPRPSGRLAGPNKTCDAPASHSYIRSGPRFGQGQHGPQRVGGTCGTDRGAEAHLLWHRLAHQDRKQRAGRRRKEAGKSPSAYHRPGCVGGAEGRRRSSGEQEGEA